MPGRSRVSPFIRAATSAWASDFGMILLKAVSNWPQFLAGHCRVSVGETAVKVTLLSCPANLPSEKSVGTAVILYVPGIGFDFRFRARFQAIVGVGLDK